jgi:hypothetical protein
MAVATLDPMTDEKVGTEKTELTNPYDASAVFNNPANGPVPTLTMPANIQSGISTLQSQANQGMSDIQNIQSQINPNEVNAENTLAAQKQPTTQFGFLASGGISNTLKGAAQQIAIQNTATQVKSAAAKIAAMGKQGAQLLYNDAINYYGKIDLSITQYVPRPESFVDANGNFDPIEYQKHVAVGVNKFKEVITNRKANKEQGAALGKAQTATDVAASGLNLGVGVNKEAVMAKNYDMQNQAKADKLAKDDALKTKLQTMKDGTAKVVAATRAKASEAKSDDSIKFFATQKEQARKDLVNYNNAISKITKAMQDQEDSDAFSHALSNANDAAVQVGLDANSLTKENLVTTLRSLQDQRDDIKASLKTATTAIGHAALNNPKEPKAKAMIQSGAVDTSGTEIPQVQPKITALPPAVQAQLKEGVHTIFKNGQVWTLQGGQPVQVK